ncbi:hypothetical protein RRF57_002187 [Xylaria bambusicola]|uniref:Uncharacterized protein n=1 Tax=Xylaria bambusicola TaxID=326684 RepID=A0AAN7UEX0_9PEZI
MYEGAPEQQVEDRSCNSPWEHGRVPREVFAVLGRSNRSFGVWKPEENRVGQAEIGKIRQDIVSELSSLSGEEIRSRIRRRGIEDGESRRHTRRIGRFNSQDSRSAPIGYRNTAAQV